MRMALADCGTNFHVRQKPRRSLLLAAIVCITILTFLAVLGPGVLVFVPMVVWVLVLARIEDAPARVALVLVAMDRISFGVRSIAFAEVRSVHSRGHRVVVRASKHALAFDASLLDPFARLCLVRHIEARVLLARSARRRTRAERAALEAFHVFRGATAVRIHERTVVELFDGEGPWTSARKGRLYARTITGAPATAYRTNARVNAIEVGSLQ